jgi:hypothetical protein
MTNPGDTGPPYPAPDPTSNEIGKFTIGVSPIGTIPPFDIWTTLISQFANSPQLTAMITAFAADIDQTFNIDLFFDDIFNVNTAQGYGLDVWGRIVGVNRIITVTTVLPFFGFEEATDAVGFNQAPFYSGQFVTTNFILNDLSYRKLILVKAFANIVSCSIPNLNQMLLTLFPGRGNVFVTEGGTLGPWFGFKEATDALGFNQAQFFDGVIANRMVMTYTFKFQPTPLELAIVQNSGVLPKPTGVKATVVVSP